MEIFQYTPDMQTPLTQFYNRLTADVPHCYPIMEEEFTIALRGVTTHKVAKGKEGLNSEIAFVAMTKGVVQAFIHVGIEQFTGKEDIGLIRFLGYERGARHAGQAVLEKAEVYLKTFNVTRISAFRSGRRYHFYHLEYADLSAALDQVQALLEFNGYHRYHGWVFLDWENYVVTPMPSSLPVTFSVRWEQGRGQRPNSIIKAYQNDEQIGLCESVSGGESSSHADAQDWLHTVYLDIEEEFQGRGLGKFLLQYALQEMHKVGYRHAAISTEWNDYRPLLFYSNFGYRAVDRTYEFVKILSEIPRHN